MELFITGPEGLSNTVELRKDSLSLGRSAENDLAFPEDPWLSRSHLCFERRENGWFVRDCQSRNGTVLNAATLKEPHRLQSGDRIYAGHLVIEVRDRNADHKKNIVSFVPQTEESTREATIVTSLDKALGRTRATP